MGDAETDGSWAGLVRRENDTHFFMRLISRRGRKRKSKRRSDVEMSRARYFLTQMRTELFLVSNYGRSARIFAQGSEDLRAQGPIGPEIKQ